MNPQPVRDPLHDLLLDYHFSPANEKVFPLIAELSKADETRQHVTGSMQMSMAGAIDGLFDSKSDAINWNDEMPSGLLNRSADARAAYPAQGPGWNDYYMAYWMVSGSESALEAIALRVRGLGFSLDVRQSARWMVQSMAQQLPGFGEAFNRLQMRLGGIAEQPPEFPGPMPGYGLPAGTGLEPYIGILQKWLESMMPSEEKQEAKRQARSREMDEEDERQIGVKTYLDGLANGLFPEQALEQAERAVYVWRIRMDQRRQAAEPKAEE